MSVCILKKFRPFVFTMIPNEVIPSFTIYCFTALFVQVRPPLGDDGGLEAAGKLAQLSDNQSHLHTRSQHLL